MQDFFEVEVKWRPLLEALNFIHDNPEKHEQGTWMDGSVAEQCGTQGCLFGWGLYMSGRMALNFEGRLVPISTAFINHGHGNGYLEEGANLFGLTLDDAAELSYGYNTVSRLWWLANKYSKGVILIPDDVEVEETDKLSYANYVEHIADTEE